MKLNFSFDSMMYGGLWAKYRSNGDQLHPELPLSISPRKIIRSSKMICLILIDIPHQDRSPVYAE